jgi:hypothetical protein
MYNTPDFFRFRGLLRFFDFRFQPVAYITEGLSDISCVECVGFVARRISLFLNISDVIIM